MKKRINDLLFKMQSGENCIGETSNQLEKLFGGSEVGNEELSWSSDDIDATYLTAAFIVGGIDGLSVELKRLEELGLQPHEVMKKVRNK